MLEKDIPNTFALSVKKRFMELGFPLSTSAELSELILPVKIDTTEKKVLSRCDNFFYLEQIIKPYQEEIQSITQDCWGHEFVFQLDSNLKNNALSENKPQNIEPIILPKQQPIKKPDLPDTQKNSNVFSFKNYIQYHSNDSAIKACEYIISKQGKQFSPLLIFSKTGLGKTHLLHATGQKYQEINPNSRIGYISSADFVNEVIHKGIRLGKMEEIRNRYKQCDLLLVDDFDILEKKPACQNEFLNILNSILHKKKPVIICANKPPKEFQHISNRLKSRLLQGILIEIKAPTYADRIKILEINSKIQKIALSNFQIECIANAVQDNVRELNGLLNDIAFQSSLNTNQNTLHDNFADTVSNRIQLNHKAKQQNFLRLQKKVCEYFNIELQDLQSHKRTQEIALARHLFIYVTKHYLNYKTSEIIKFFGRKHPKIVSYSSKKIGLLSQKNIEVKAHLEHLKHIL